MPKHILIPSGVLELVNKARSASGLPPLDRLPSGIRDTSRQCVLGRSLGVEILLGERDVPFALVLDYRRACALARAWNSGRPSASWNGWAVQMPPLLCTFVREFDACCYPELVSAEPDTNSVSVPETRSLRVDWFGQSERIQGLLGKARIACERAHELCIKTSDQ